MTAIELRSSIMSDLNSMGVEMLEAVARYVHSLGTPAAQPTSTTPSTTLRKIQISDKINKLRGQFVIPAEMETKEAVAAYLTDKHVGQ